MCSWTSEIAWEKNFITSCRFQPSILAGALKTRDEKFHRKTFFKRKKQKVFENINIKRNFDKLLCTNVVSFHSLSLYSWCLYCPISFLSFPSVSLRFLQLATQLYSPHFPLSNEARKIVIQTVFQYRREVYPELLQNRKLRINTEREENTEKRKL